MTGFRTGFAVALVLAPCAGCGTRDPAGDSDTAGSDSSGSTTDAGPATGRYLPLAVGATWAWRKSDPMGGPTFDKVAVVEALEPPPGGGPMAFRIHTTNDVDAEQSWQEDTGVEIRRLFEQILDLGGATLMDSTYVPYKVRIDESPARTAMGATWTETYDETDVDYTMGGATTTTTKMYRWTVEAVSESVTVPAGSFECLRVHRVGLNTAYDKTFWFARGVGKVREIGVASPTEELLSYSLP